MSKTKSKPEVAIKPLPAYRIYSVLDNGTDNPVWQEIGSAWLHRKDGLGLNLFFKARPLEGARIVLRAPKAKPA